jgi:hypothetical protein
MRKHREIKNLTQKDFSRRQINEMKISYLELKNTGSPETFLNYLYALMDVGVSIESLFLNGNKNDKEINKNFDYLGIVKNMKYYRIKLSLKVSDVATELNLKQWQINRFEMNGSGKLDLFYNYFVLLLNKGIPYEKILFQKNDDLVLQKQQIEAIKGHLDEIKNDLDNLI